MTLMTLLRSGLLLLMLIPAMPLMAQQECPSGIPRVAPDLRYTVSQPVAGELVVTDLDTGLMWKRCSEGRSGAGCATGSTSLVRWSLALAQANASTFAGFNDWRLPNRAELRSLVETGCASPAINAVVFPATTTGEYWSSTSRPSTVSGWTVDFRLGGISFNNKIDPLPVRLVRGGQRFDTFSAEADSVPNSFSLVAQTGVPTGSERTSDPITVAGLTTVTGIGVSGAAGSSYSINGGTFGSQPGTVANGDVVRVRHTSAATAGAQASTSLFIGGVTADFVSTTLSDLVFRSGFE